MKSQVQVVPIRVEFRVHGVPQPQGSTRAFLPKGHTRPIITSDNAKNKPWRQEIAGMANVAMQQGGHAMTLGPVSVKVYFDFDRPKTVKSQHKTTKPDVDKLLRSCLDSLSGIVFKDDAQVIHTEVWKGFGTPGARVIVESVL